MSSPNSKREISIREWTAVAISFISLIFAVRSNWIAQDANQISKDSNDIALRANSLSEKANQLAENSITSKIVVRDIFDVDGAGSYRDGVVTEICRMRVRLGNEGGAPAIVDAISANVSVAGSVAEINYYELNRPIPIGGVLLRIYISGKDKQDPLTILTGNSLFEPELPIYIPTNSVEPIYLDLEIRYDPQTYYFEPTTKQGNIVEPILVDKPDNLHIAVQYVFHINQKDYQQTSFIICGNQEDISNSEWLTENNITWSRETLY